MRNLRWKQKFISGFNCLDQSKRQLYQELQNLQTEMAQKEHCQDMRDLMGKLNGQASNLFETNLPNQLKTHVTGVSQTLDQHLPLAALHTPACRACTICDRTDELLNGWLEQTRSRSENHQDCAA